MRIDTWATVGGHEQDVAVDIDHQPAEYDTNTPEGVEVTAVYFEDQGCVLDAMSQAEVRELESRMMEELHTIAREKYECKADYLYEQRRDIALEAQAQALSEGERRYGK